MTSLINNDRGLILHKTNFNKFLQGEAQDISDIFVSESTILRNFSSPPLTPLFFFFLLYVLTNEKDRTRRILFSRFSRCCTRRKKNRAERNERRNNNAAGHLRSGRDRNTRWGLSSLSRTKRGYKTRHVAIRAAT